MRISSKALGTHQIAWFWQALEHERLSESQKKILMLPTQQSKPCCTLSACNAGVPVDLFCPHMLWHQNIARCPYKPPWAIAMDTFCPCSLSQKQCPGTATHTDRRFLFPHVWEHSSAQAKVCLVSMSCLIASPHQSRTRVRALAWTSFASSASSLP